MTKRFYSPLEIRESIYLFESYENMQNMNLLARQGGAAGRGGAGGPVRRPGRHSAGGVEGRVWAAAVQCAGGARAHLAADQCSGMNK